MEAITIKDILYLIGAITAIISFVALISKPHKELRESLAKNEETIEDLSNTIKVQQKLLNSSIKVQMLLMEHIIYGNHVDAIKTELAELQSTILDVNK